MVIDPCQQALQMIPTCTMYAWRSLYASSGILIAAQWCAQPKDMHMHVLTACVLMLWARTRSAHGADSCSICDVPSGPRKSAPSKTTHPEAIAERSLRPVCQYRRRVRMQGYVPRSAIMRTKACSRCTHVRSHKACACSHLVHWRQPDGPGQHNR